MKLYFLLLFFLFRYSIIATSTITLLLSSYNANHGKYLFCVNHEYFTFILVHGKYIDNGRCQICTRYESTVVIHCFLVTNVSCGVFVRWSILKIQIGNADRSLGIKRRNGECRLTAFLINQP